MSSPEPSLLTDPQTPARPSRTRLGWSFGVALLVIAVGAVFVAGIVAPSPGAVASPEASPRSISDYDVALLEQPADVPVTMPKYLDVGSVGTGGLDVDSFRQLATEGGTTYLLGLSNSTELCMIVELPGDISGTSCTTPEDFATTALAVRVQGPGHVAEGYVIPDRIADGGSNLLTIDPLLSAAERDRLTVPGGYELQPLVPMNAEDRETLSQ